MRMGLDLILRAAVMLAALLVVALPVLGEEDGDEATDEILRFVERASAWYPDSKFEVADDERTVTPSGAYRVVTIERACDSKFLAGTQVVLVDERSRTAWFGGVARLPATGAGAENLQEFLTGFLPDILRESLRLKAEVAWEERLVDGAAVIPFSLRIDTGYGEHLRPAAVTADGTLMTMGYPLSLDTDPVQQRRSLLRSAREVIWDRPATDEGVVEIVEFSDLECPACRSRWELIEEVLAAHPDTVRHGMVSLPLTTIHPWAFRAASASWCVSAQDPTMLIPFKEMFYALQPEMSVSMVTPTATDFVVGYGLDEAAFEACYLADESVSAVHDQLALGALLGINATPTYIVNGWLVQVPAPEWFPAMVERLA